MGNLRWIRYRIFDWMRETWSRLLGYRLAQWIDSRHPEWCWAEICVCLGLGYDVKHWRKKSRDSGTCNSAPRSCNTRTTVATYLYMLKEDRP
jgi:hypothetical protein